MALPTELSPRLEGPGDQGVSSLPSWQTSGPGCCQECARGFSKGGCLLCPSCRYDQAPSHPSRAGTKSHKSEPGWSLVRTRPGEHSVDVPVARRAESLLRASADILLCSSLSHREPGPLEPLWLQCRRGEWFPESHTQRNYEHVPHPRASSSVA